MFRNRFRNYLYRFLSDACDEPDPEWIIVLPVLHFLQSYPVGPAALVEVGMKHDDEQWWALKNIESVANRFKQKIRDKHE